jgi:phosphoglycolate phosphatase
MGHTPIAVLFDVDGTLIDSGGAGERSWRHAFEVLCGIPADIGRSSNAGMTDPDVARLTFAATLGREPTASQLARLFAIYLLRLADEVARSPGYRVLPGAERTLRSLVHEGALLGIVSGAMEGAARIKLARGRLDRFFVFGGYGSDSADRVELTRGAMARAEALHGHDLRASDFLVVGDTPLDVLAARGAGAISVAVASGKYSEEELRRAGADHVLGSLQEPLPRLDLDPSDPPGTPPIGQGRG